MDGDEEFSCILCEEKDFSRNLQKVSTGIKTLVKSCKYLEKHDEHSRLKEARRKLETTPIFVHNNCRKQVTNDVRKRKVREEDCKRRKTGRQTEVTFEWKNNCVICDGICDEFSEKWSLCDVKRKDNPESTRDTILKLVANIIDDRSLSVY